VSLEKAKGVILGLAIGDAMGAPAEFMTLGQIKRVYGARGIRDLPDLAVYTDDTQMSIAILLPGHRAERVSPVWQTWKRGYTGLEADSLNLRDAALL